MEITLGPSLTAEEAQAIYEQGPEAVVFALLQMAKLLAEKQRKPEDSPSTPSGMKAVYQKEPTKQRRRSRDAKKDTKAVVGPGRPSSISRWFFAWNVAPSARPK